MHDIKKRCDHKYDGLQKQVTLSLQFSGSFKDYFLDRTGLAHHSLQNKNHATHLTIVAH